MIDYELRKALTELAGEISKSLRHDRETEHVTYYTLRRWRDGIKKLLEFLSDEDGKPHPHPSTDAERAFYDVKEGCLDELNEMLAMPREIKEPQ